MRDTDLGAASSLGDVLLLDRYVVQRSTFTLFSFTKPGFCSMNEEACPVRAKASKLSRHRPVP